MFPEAQEAHDPSGSGGEMQAGKPEWQRVPRWHWRRLFGFAWRRRDYHQKGFEYKTERGLAKDFLRSRFGARQR